MLSSIEGLFFKRTHAKKPARVFFTHSYQAGTALMQQRLAWAEKWLQDHPFKETDLDYLEDGLSATE